jgi:hypothetical protein
VVVTPLPSVLVSGSLKLLYVAEVARPRGSVVESTLPLASTVWVVVPPLGSVSEITAAVAGSYVHDVVAACGVPYPTVCATRTPYSYVSTVTSPAGSVMVVAPPSDELGSPE